MIAPTSSTFHATRHWRREPRGRGGIAAGVAVALVANLLVLAVLTAVTRTHHAPPPPVLAALRVAEVTPPAEPPPPPTAEPAPAEPAAAALPMPALELPAMPASDLALPALAPADAPLDLPSLVPAFAVAEAAPAIAAPAPAVVAVDEPARLAAAFDLDRFYPRAARIRRIEGRTLLRFRIDEQGLVTGCEVVESTPPGVFDQAAVRLSRTLRFTPATRGGKPVATVQDQVLTWNMDR